jgi:preprotein translocase subunit YajC
MLVSNILAASDNEGSPFTFVIFLLIPLAMYFLLIRPQRRRMREQAALQAAISIGDEVMTTSGIYGFITGFDGDIVWLEIDENIQVRVARAAVQRKVDTASAEAPPAGATDVDAILESGGSTSTDRPTDGDANKK